MRRQKIDHEVSRHPKYWKLRWKLRRMDAANRRRERRLDAWLDAQLLRRNADLFEELDDGRLVLRGDDDG